MASQQVVRWAAMGVAAALFFGKVFLFPGAGAARWNEAQAHQAADPSRSESRGLRASGPAVRATNRGPVIFRSSRRIAEVTARVEGRIVALASVSPSPHRQADSSQLRPGDRVSKGQRLATIWSPQLGETKSRYLAAASRLICDQDSLKKILVTSGEARQFVQLPGRCQMDYECLARAERALRALDMGEREFESIRLVADQVYAGRRDNELLSHWSELAVRAPQDGIVLTAATMTDSAVQPATVLYTIAVEEPAEAAVPRHHLPALLAGGH